MPKRLAASTSPSRSVELNSVLAGMQPRRMHVPPSSPGPLTSSTDLPCDCAYCAAAKPAVPAPTTQRSYRSSIQRPVPERRKSYAGGTLTGRRAAAIPRTSAIDAKNAEMAPVQPAP